ncbi:hypothetical protein HDV00_007726 [Rhizophlyctis rosea]|nr:hypothetical protein HDV00_007726 [Rhizophlyctis rosea]
MQIRLIQNYRATFFQFEDDIRRSNNTETVSTLHKLNRPPGSMAVITLFNRSETTVPFEHHFSFVKLENGIVQIYTYHTQDGSIHIPPTMEPLSPTFIFDLSTLGNQPTTVWNTTIDALYAKVCNLDKHITKTGQFYRPD